MPVVGGGIYIPEAGDRIDYEDRAASYMDRVVTKTVAHGGYTDIWFDGFNGFSGSEAPFNINHTTGNPNTEYRTGGKWRLILKKGDQPVTPRTFTLPTIPDDVDRIATIGASVQFKRVKRPADMSELWEHVTFGGYWTFGEMLTEYPDGFTEVLESTYEAAVRRLRASGFTRTTTDALTYSQTVDIRIIAAHVMEDSNV